MALQRQLRRGKTLSSASKVPAQEQLKTHAQESKAMHPGLARTSTITSTMTSQNESEWTEKRMGNDEEEDKTDLTTRSSEPDEFPLEPTLSSIANLFGPPQTAVRSSTARGRIFPPIQSPSDASTNSSSLMESFVALAHQSTEKIKEELKTKEAEIQFPIRPVEAMKMSPQHLTEFEQGEILEFRQIFFLGLPSSNKIHGSSALSNYGFDDEKGNYKLLAGDHIAYRYEILSFLGKGSFGQVCKCFDHKEKELVALKIIKNRKKYRQQGAVEVKVLELLRDNDPEDAKGVVKMKTSFLFRRHICITFELLDSSLLDLLKTTNHKGMSQSLARRFGLQLILALQYMKSAGVIHCDLKPENVLLKQPSKSGIKIIDFGSSCLETEKVYTYIQSRYYRAPEVILGIPYTPAIDMWSLGCLLAELFLGTPLFQGENEHDQLLCMMEILGTPPKEVLQTSSRKKLFFDGNTARLQPNTRGKKHVPDTKTLHAVLKGASPLFLDFIRQCFNWNPATRLTPEAALAHGWIQEGILKMQQETITQSKKGKPEGDKKKVTLGAV